jgi:S1-C subfamily serine protease
MKNSFVNWVLTFILAFGITIQVSANQLKLDVSAIAKPNLNVFLQSKQNFPDNSEAKLSPGMLDKLKQRLRDSDIGTEALQELLWNAKHGSLNDVKITRGAKEVSLFKKIAPSVVRVYAREGAGTGFFVENSDLILTNAHVVGASKFLKVALMPKTRDQLTKNSYVDGWVISIDEEVDLALIQLVRSVAKVKLLELASNDSLEIGQDVHAIGHPRTGALWSYTKGYIGQLLYDYEWGYDAENTNKASMVIQTQTPIYFGNSGGPLLNDEGLVVGVNTFVSDEYSSVNGAVSAGDVRLFLQKNRKKPEVKEKDSQAKSISREWAANVVLVGKADYFMDGVLDTLYYIDDDYSGYAEEVYIESGKANGGWVYEYDPDEDGLWNEKGIDANNNDFWELILYDEEEEDNVVDMQGVDLDDDGEIDEWESFE